MPSWHEFLIRTSIVRSGTVSPRHDTLPDPNNLLTFFQKGVRYNQLAAEIHPKDGCGGPKRWGVFRFKDRVLPDPSPSANLVGMWKGNRQKE